MKVKLQRSCVCVDVKILIDNVFLVVEINESMLSVQHTHDDMKKLGSGYFAVNSNLPSETILP